MLKGHYVEWSWSFRGKSHYSDVYNPQWHIPSKISVEESYAVINLFKIILKENYALLLQHDCASPIENSSI